MPTKRKNNQGFILLEVIVAVAVLAGGLVVVLRALSQTTAVEAELKNRSQAMILLQEKSAELREDVLMGVSGEAIALSEMSGTFPDRSEDFKWKVTPETDPETGAAWAVVTVSWGKDSGEASVVTRTLITPPLRERKEETE